MRMLFELDVRDVLPSIRVPTLVVHHRDNPIVTIDQGRFVADHIEGASFVAVPGADYGLGIGDIDVLIDEVEEFLTGWPAHTSDRVLATVLFTDIVDSTPRAVELGDARWRELLERHDELAATEVARFGGTISDFAGDGLLATFDGPGRRAVRCAFALRNRLRTLDLDMRAGLHTGEVERRSGGIAGIGVHIAARVNGLAGAGEVLVSRTVRDLVTGSGLTFVERGSHALKGVPDHGRSSKQSSDDAGGAAFLGVGEWMPSVEGGEALSHASRVLAMPQVCRARKIEWLDIRKPGEQHLSSLWKGPGRCLPRERRGQVG